jgi:phosphatidylglycerol lysyltransferase
MIAPPAHELHDARELVLRYGWNSTAYQILNPGIAHWYAPGRRAVVGYVRWGRHVIAAGGPVCAQAELPEVASQFETWAAAEGRQVCYFGAEGRLRDLLDRSEEHTTVALGAQPVWDPRTWEADVVGKLPSLRSQIRRARRKGIEVERVSPTAARDDAAVRACLAAWLGSKPLPPMQFLVQPETLKTGSKDHHVFVARRTLEDGSRRTAAFLVASPVPGQNGFLVEQIARRPDAPNGTSEVLIDAAMREFAGMGCGYATLGLVALADHAREVLARNPAWLRVLLAWARAHGRRFYNFAGIEAFRAKMAPQRWDAVYAIVNRPRFSLGTLHAVAGAFCGASPELAVLRGLGRAARQEAARAGRRVRRMLSTQR